VGKKKRGFKKKGRREGEKHITFKTPPNIRVGYLKKSGLQKTRRCGAKGGGKRDTRGCRDGPGVKGSEKPTEGMSEKDRVEHC